MISSHEERELIKIWDGSYGFIETINSPDYYHNSQIAENIYDKSAYYNDKKDWQKYLLLRDIRYIANRELNLDVSDYHLEKVISYI